MSTTPNEQPVSDTPRSDSKFDVQKFHREAQGLVNKSDHISLMAGTPLISDVAVWMANFSMRNRDFARQLERELNQANEKLQRLSRMIDIAEAADDAKSEAEIATSASFSEAMAYTNAEMLEKDLEQANLYRAELEAVARAAFDVNPHLPIAYGETKNLRQALESLKAKGWKA